MKQRILDYRKKIDKLLSEKPAGTDWTQVEQEHLVQISFFQHERLIHLLVTLSFAVFTMLSIGIVIATEYFPMLVAAALFLVLLIPYVFHYYLLENEVQKMYGQYDAIRNEIAQNRK